MFDNILYIPLFVGPVFFIIGYFAAKNPPKDMSKVFAYRSKNALKSQKHWNFAQNYASRELMNLGFFLSLTCLIGKFITLDAQNNLIAGIAMVVFTIVLWIFKVERAIKDEFGK